VIEAASQPGVSVAAIALANGLNANLLSHWITMAHGPSRAGCVTRAFTTHR